MRRRRPAASEMVLAQNGEASKKTSRYWELLLPAAAGLTAAPRVVASLSRGLEVGSIATPSVLSEPSTRKSVELVLM